MGLQICFDTLKVFCNNTMSTTNFDPASWTLLRGWDKVDKSYGVQPGDFPARPWILYCPETHHLYLSKRGQEDPPTDQWYQVYQGGDREPTEEPCLAVDIVGGTAQIRILQHTDASGEGPLPSTKPIPKPRSPVQKAWILRRGWDKVSESYGVQPSDFPVNPWVLYCPRTHHLYLSKSFQATPPTGQWYQLYQDRGEPTEEPCIAIEIVDGTARILDTREYADARRFSGEACILVRDSEKPSEALETELVRRISSVELPSNSWNVTAFQRVSAVISDSARNLWEQVKDHFAANAIETHVTRHKEVRDHERETSTDEPITPSAVCADVPKSFNVKGTFSKCARFEEVSNHGTKPTPL